MTSSTMSGFILPRSHHRDPDELSVAFVTNSAAGLFRRFATVTVWGPFPDRIPSSSLFEPFCFAWTVKPFAMQARKTSRMPRDVSQLASDDDDDASAACVMTLKPGFGRAVTPRVRARRWGVT